MTTVSTSAGAPASATFQTPQVSIWAVLVAVVLVLAHLPVLWTYTGSLLDLPHYDFIVLLPLGAAVLAIERLRGAGTLQPGHWYAFLPLIAFSMAVMSASVVLNSPWLGAISALFALLSVIYGLGGWKFTRRMLPVWAFLWLGVRLPLNLDVDLTTFLQAKAATWASSLLTKMGVLHVLEGNVVEVPGKRYMVEEACSGIQSLFAVTVCTLFFVLWTRRPWPRSIVLLVCAWGWVLVDNVMRVVGVTVLNSRFGLPVDEGFGHTVFAMCLFAITLALIISTDRLLLFAVPPGMFKRDEVDFELDTLERPLPNYGATRLPQFHRTWVASRAVFGCYALLAIVQWLPVWLVTPPEPIPQAMARLDEDALPAQLGQWKRVNYEVVERERGTQWGETSQIWQYRNDTHHMVVSVDYPFRGWHELTTCYESDGWLLQDREVVSYHLGVIDNPERCVKVELLKPQASTFAHLLFSNFNSRREPIPVPRDLGFLSEIGERWDVFIDRLSSMGASGGGVGPDAQTFQLQLFIEGFVPVDDEQKRQAHVDFSRVRSILDEHFASQEGAQ